MVHWHCTEEFTCYCIISLSLVEIQHIFCCLEIFSQHGWNHVLVLLFLVKLKSEMYVSGNTDWSNLSIPVDITLVRSIRLHILTIPNIYFTLCTWHTKYFYNTILLKSTLKAEDSKMLNDPGHKNPIINYFDTWQRMTRCLLSGLIGV